MDWRQKLNHAVDKYKPSVQSPASNSPQVSKQPALERDTSFKLSASPGGALGEGDAKLLKAKAAPTSALGSVSESMEDTMRQLDIFTQSLSEAGRPEELAQIEAVRARDRLRLLSPSLGMEQVPTERGILVTKITPGEAAERAGLRSGDLLLKVGARSARDEKAMKELKAGETVAVEVERRQSDLVVVLQTFRLRVGGVGVPLQEIDTLAEAAAFPEHHRGPVPERWANLIDPTLFQALSSATAQAEDAQRSLSSNFASVMQRAASLLPEQREGKTTTPLKGEERKSSRALTTTTAAVAEDGNDKEDRGVMGEETSSSSTQGNENTEGEFGTLTESALQESEKLRRVTSLTIPDVARVRSILVWEPTNNEDAGSEQSEMESISSETVGGEMIERPSVVLHLPSEPRGEVAGNTPPSSDCEEEVQEKKETYDDKPFVDYFLAMSAVPSPAYLAKAALHPHEDIGEDVFASVRSRRYPLADRVESPMPESVSVFTFGAGAKTVYIKSDGSFDDQQRIAKVAGVTYFSFVLTDIHSGRLYASCAQYYTVVPNAPGVYAARTLCFLSRVPFLHSLREALTVLVAMEGCPVDPTLPSPEQLVVHLTEEVHVPRPGGPSVRFVIGGTQFELNNPGEREFPLLDHDLRSLFEHLNIDSVLNVLVGLLTEQKIVMHSARTATLTYVTEACLALLFPFRWYHVYIPVLPSALLDVCDAPVPFLVGMNSSLLEGLTNEQKDKIMIVDLDGNSVKFPRKFKTRMPSKLQTSVKQQVNSLLHPELVSKNTSSGRRGSSSVSRSMIEQDDCTTEDYDQELLTGSLAAALGVDLGSDGDTATRTTAATMSVTSSATDSSDTNEQVPIAITVTSEGSPTKEKEIPSVVSSSPFMSRADSTELSSFPPPSVSTDLSSAATTTASTRFPPLSPSNSLSALSTRRTSLSNNVPPLSPARERRENNFSSEVFPISLGGEVDQELNVAIRKVFLEAYSLLLQDFRQFLFFMGDGVPIFNAEEFVALHRRRHTGMLEAIDPSRRSQLKWLGVHQAAVQPFLCQFLSTHVFAMFLEECQYPNPFHVFLSTKQTLGSKRLHLHPPRTRECIRVPPPVPHHPYYPTTMSATHVNHIKKQIKRRNVRPSPIPPPSSSFMSSWRTPPKAPLPTLPLPPEPDLLLPFPVRVCDWLETKREWSIIPRNLVAVYSSQPSITVPRYFQAKRRREMALRRCEHTESFNRLQTFLSYIFLSQKPETGKQAEKMHALFLQCKRSMSEKQSRRALALLLDHPSNLVSQKSRLSSKKFVSMSSLMKKFLDACLKERDYKSGVSALTAGSTFFCLKRSPATEAKASLASSSVPPAQTSPRAQSLTDFLNAPTSPTSPTDAGDEDDSVGAHDSNPAQASDPDLLSYFLENSIKDHAIFLHASFWRKAFREALHKLSFQEDMLSFEPEGRQDLVQLLGMMINKMLFFGRNITFVTNFIREKSVGLSESDSKMLEMLALNIFRAR